MRKLLTIFTPTYNRAYTLQTLYDSLIRQTSHNFIWLVINDGSSDNTDEVIRNMINENKIQIKYITQQNSGKHAAHNRAVKECDTELFFCVDSDDFLTDDAVSTIEAYWSQYKNTDLSDISGFVANKGNIHGHILGSEFPNGTNMAGLSQLYELGKKGDTALIFRTKVIAKYPFPVFEGENFLREHIAYDEIDKSYKLIVINKIIYICDYLKDGLSKNATKLELLNPKGAALTRYHDYKKATTPYNKFRLLSGYVYFSKRAGNLKEVFDNIGIIRTIIMLFPAFFSGIRYKYRSK